MADPTTGISFHDDLQFASLSDARLNARLMRVAVALAARPVESFPDAFATEAEVQAFYRLMNNERVTFDNIVAPHHAATAARCSEHTWVRLIHDTTEALFSGETPRRGLGRINGNDQGFLLHVTLAVTADAIPKPLGVLAATPWTRGAKKTPKAPVGQSGRHGEFRRWEEQALLAESQVPEGTRSLHLMDAEADAYALIATLSKPGSDFIIRASQDRVVVAFDRPLAEAQGRLRQTVARAPVVLEREVRLAPRSAKGRTPTSRKEHPPREGRLARLGIAATKVVLRRSPTMPRDLPSALSVHVVSVIEIDPPQDRDPVDWLLITQLPIDTPEQLAAIVDHYRARWLIEEFNKALKTGCSLEARQLESLHGLLNATAIFIPIAGQMLALRTAERTEPDAPATDVLSKRQVQILRVQKHLKLPERPTVRDALLAIARMGGHLRRNGPPGWLTLARGFRELMILEEGWLAAEAALRGCDES